MRMHRIAVNLAVSVPSDRSRYSVENENFCTLTWLITHRICIGFVTMKNQIEWSKNYVCFVGISGVFCQVSCT